MCYNNYIECLSLSGVGIVSDKQQYYSEGINTPVQATQTPLAVR